MATVNQQKVFYTQPGMAEEIENFRHGRRLKSEAEALRVIVRAGLDALEGSAPKLETKRRIN
jgi:hypothetical protein